MFKSAVAANRQKDLFKNVSVGQKDGRLVQLFLVVYTFIQIFPLFWLLLFSLKSTEQIFAGGVFSIPDPVYWENYVTVFRNLNIIVPLKNSFIVTAITIVCTLLFSCMAAYGAKRLKFRFGDKMVLYFTMGIMIPVHAALLPLFLIFKNLGMLNSYGALIIAYVAFSIPQATFIIAGFINSIPRELDEAAEIDGCSPYGIFFKIIVPLLRPVVATVAIFVYMHSWNELMFSMTLNSKTALATLPVAILSYQSDYVINWGVIGAAMVIALLPTYITYFSFSNQIQKSLMAGAIKG